MKKILFPLVLLLLSSCSKFLDEKPDSKLAIPTTAADFQALLDADWIMNVGDPIAGEIGSDDYYLLNSSYQSMNFDLRSNYIWDKDANLDSDWSYPYMAIASANIVLDNIHKIENGDQTVYNTLKGAAIFFRGRSFLNLAQQHCIAYDPATAPKDLGIVLRLTSDINNVSFRSSLQESYVQIIADLRVASELLPQTSEIATRPTKAAAYGELARTYLYMGDYVLAQKYADSCLRLNSFLMDYNEYNVNSQSPFPSFNKEVIFYSRNTGAAPLYQSNSIVDSMLYRSFDDNDLRKQLFFASNGNGTYRFKGTYDGTLSGGVTTSFSGVTTDELYLIRSECAARNNDKQNALSDLNTLLRNRWRKNTFTDIQAQNAEEALKIIIVERRKELIFRNRRWADLKRLNKDSRFARTLERNLNGVKYFLPPGDLRYALLIPAAAATFGNIVQNPR